MASELKLKSFIFNAICFAFIFWLELACESPDQKKDNELAKQKVESRVIRIDSSHFGYEILTNGKVFVRQTMLPGIEGKVLIEDSLVADGLAKLVVQKMEQSIQLPTLTKEEVTKVLLQNK